MSHSRHGGYPSSSICAWTPYERAQITSNSYFAWTLKKAFIMYGGQAIAGAFAKSLEEFPPRQRPQSFNLDQIMEKLKEPTND